MIPFSPTTFRSLYAVLGLSLTCFVLGCAAEEGPPAVSDSPAGALPDYTIGAVREATHRDGVNLVGVLTLAPDGRRVLAMPDASLLVSWNVKVGDKVEAGQQLAELAPQEVAAIHGQYAAARRTLAAHQRHVEHLKENVKTGVSTVGDVHDAELAMQDSRSVVESLRRQLEARQKIGIQSSGAAHTWVASAAGEVAEVGCAPGTFVERGVPCLELIDPSGALLRVAVPQSRLTQLADLKRATWAPHDGAEPVELERVRSASTLHPATKTQDVFFARRSSDGAGLKDFNQPPGSTGRVLLRWGVPEGTVQVPRVAVVQMEGKNIVFASDKKGAEPVAVEVELLGESGEEVVVRSKSLRLGDKIVTRGAFQLKSARLLNGGA